MDWINTPNCLVWFTALSFSKSCDEIFKLHSSNIIKQELLRGAIQAADDKQLVKEFFQQKYSSESAVPRLINPLFNMKPCQTEKQSCDNLTKLISVKQQIDSNKAKAKLASSLVNKFQSV